MAVALPAAVSGLGVLVPYLSPGHRSTTWFSTAALAAGFVLAAGPGARRAGLDIALAAGLGLVAGVNLASDQLLVLSGLLPFAGAGAAYVLARGEGARRVGMLVGATCLLGVLVAAGTAVGMRGLGFFTPTGPAIALATPRQVLVNLHNFGADVLALGNAVFLHEVIGIGWAARVVAA